MKVFFILVNWYTDNCHILLHIKVVSKKVNGNEHLK